jgi:predicted GH43/DUF377 family glycosyl hydrolase
MKTNMAELKKKTKKVVKKSTKKKKVVVKKTTIKKKIKKVVRKISLKTKIPSIVKKFEGNPIIEPKHNSFWESEAVFNPAAVVHDGRVHLFYRALGVDGVSRIGHISSSDGINFDDRLPYPVYAAQEAQEVQKHYPHTSPARLIYDPSFYTSGGGWGGCEDPRAVKIDGRIYMTFNMFNGWHSMRVAFTSISEQDLTHKVWNWSKFVYLSRPGDRQKNWVLFPEKINGKFALFHNLDKGDPSRVHIAYINKLDMSETPGEKDAVDPQGLPDHIVAWHNRTRSASAPPIKTSDGWLLFYHAMDKDDPNRYKVGALLLDLKDPTKVLYRSSRPVLEPDEWYENDYKPGIIYASGAVVKDGTLFLYYGGGDKRIAVAYAKLDDFLRKLKNKEHAVFSKKTVIKV